MKKIILTVAVALTVISCSKESVTPDCGCTEYTYQTGAWRTGKVPVSNRKAEICEDKYLGYDMTFELNGDTTFTHRKVTCK